MMKKIILLLTIILMASGCKADEIDFKGMESAETKYNQTQKNERVAYMSIDTMFTDTKVRELAKAAGKGKVVDVEKLVSQGVNVNSKGAKGATPLFWALRKNNIEGFEKLLELGADPNLLFEGGSVLHWSSKLNDISFLKSALEKGGNPNLQAGEFMETPIFSTIGVKGSDNVPAMKLLIDAGADVNAVTGGEPVFGVSMAGKSPAMIAADLARFDLVYMLLESGARFDLKDGNGKDLKSKALSKKGRFPSGSQQERELNQVLEFIAKREA